MKSDFSEVKISTKLNDQGLKITIWDDSDYMVFLYNAETCLNLIIKAIG